MRYGGYRVRRHDEGWGLSMRRWRQRASEAAGPGRRRSQIPHQGEQQDGGSDVRHLRGLRQRLVHDAAQVRQQGGEGSRIPGVVRNGRRHLHRVSVLGLLRLPNRHRAPDASVALGRGCEARASHRTAVERRQRLEYTGHPAPGSGGGVAAGAVPAHREHRVGHRVLQRGHGGSGGGGVCYLGACGARRGGGAGHSRHVGDVTYVISGLSSCSHRRSLRAAVAAAVTALKDLPHLFQ
mmetsp:Transcript_13943/g.22835  ORF Transcript_13943/g.22835 Transcript_13943/m.22835 type:complete len:237 (+) Transcript_13943:466-1176(+)